MQDGFSELSPDLFESVLETAEKESLMPLKTEYEEEKKCAAGPVLRNSEKVRRTPEVRNAFRRNFPKYAVSVCACLLVFVLWVSGIFGTKEEDVFLVLDINPSVQIVMDDSYQVKRLHGLNQDGKDVLKRIKWEKKESVFDVLDLLLQGAAENSYLQENQGILVTICLPDQKMYQELENSLGESIDQKLQEIGISGVMTAFVQGEKDANEQGREQLEAKLAEKYGLDEKQAQQMSVMELLEYCQEHAFAGVTFSAESDKVWKDLSKREGDSQSGKNSESDREKIPEPKEPENEETDAGRISQEEEKKPEEKSQEEEPFQQKPQQEEGEPSQKPQQEEEEFSQKPQQEEEPSQSQQNESREDLGTSVQSQQNTEQQAQTETPAEAEPSESPIQNQDVPVQEPPVQNNQEEDSGGKIRDKEQKDGSKKDKDNKDNKDNGNSEGNNGKNEGNNGNSSGSSNGEKNSSGGKGAGGSIEKDKDNNGKMKERQ